MPFFGPKKKNHHKDKVEQNKPALPSPSEPDNVYDSPAAADTPNEASNSMPPPAQTYRRKLAFHCQLAHGSPTGIIQDFTNVRDLYRKIAECYDISPSEILFCTLNTHKVDMKQLLGGQLGLEDFIFVHVKGRPKVVDIEKTDNALGLTITDNGAGYAFIKSIREGSIISEIEGVNVGDHIEKINDMSTVGCRHFEVAKALKDIPVGSTFTLRVVEPMKSGFSEIGSKSSGSGAKKGMGTGRETLRLRSKGAATVEQIPDDLVSTAVDRINSLLESFIGINDADLAQTIWETGNQAKNPSEFTTAIENSDLQDFGFTESFIFDLWGAISDAQQGRLAAIQNFNEQF